MVMTAIPNAGGVGSIPDWGTKIPHALWFSSLNLNEWQNFMTVLRSGKYFYPYFSMLRLRSEEVHYLA